VAGDGKEGRGANFLMGFPKGFFFKVQSSLDSGGNVDLGMDETERRDPCSRQEISVGVPLILRGGV
jgi:hypothetical protein